MRTIAIIFALSLSACAATGTGEMGDNAVATVQDTQHTVNTAVQVVADVVKLAVSSLNPILDIVSLVTTH